MYWFLGKIVATEFLVKEVVKKIVFFVFFKYEILSLYKASAVFIKDVIWVGLFEEFIHSFLYFYKIFPEYGWS